MRYKTKIVRYTKNDQPVLPVMSAEKCLNYPCLSNVPPPPRKHAPKKGVLVYIFPEKHNLFLRLGRFLV
jgi:hypothetical protein